MERVISQDERIRRAEEVYARRQMQNELRRSATVNIDNNNRDKLTKKLIVQCMVCIIIYGCFYAMKNLPNIASQNIMYKISDILEYDINVQKLYNDFSRYINKTEDASVENNEFVEETLSITENAEKENNDENTTETTITENTETTEEVQEISNTQTTETQQEPPIELSQMEIDAQYIKANFSLIKPLEGEITSRFGLRNPTVPTVPKNHTGIDIARVEGTVIISAMNGTVEFVSSEGDLGNHVKITDGDVSTVYAHCKTIYVKEGEQVTQGQQIAEVGATGNVTGPHLHFEIKRNGNYVNPDMVLQF